MSHVVAYVRRHHVALVALVLALGGTSYAAVSSRSQPAPGALQSGDTIRGTWAVSLGTDAGDPSSFAVAAVSFAQPAPVRLDNDHAVLAGNDDKPGDGCSGTAAHPVAAPGFACAYFSSAFGTSSGSAQGIPNGGGGRFGFDILVNGTDPFDGAGTWAYTAP